MADTPSRYTDLSDRELGIIQVACGRLYELVLAFPRPCGIEGEQLTPRDLKMMETGVMSVHEAMYYIVPLVMAQIEQDRTVFYDKDS